MAAKLDGQDDNMNTADDDDLDPASPERAVRQTRIFVAMMTGERTPEQEIVIRNVSSTGMGGQARECPPQQGEQVTVTMASLGPIVGVVAWVRGDRFGLQLSTPIEPSQLNFSGKDWTLVAPREEPGRKHDPYKVAGRPWRPGLKTR